MTNSRLNQLEQNVSRGRARTNVIQDYNFMVTPTCPPSTSISIRQGSAWINSNYWFFIGYKVQKPADSIDFTSMTNVGYGATWDSNGPKFNITFANSGHYKAVALCLSYFWIQQEADYDADYWEGDNWKYNVIGGNTEHATAAGAEAEIDFMLDGGYGYVPNYGATDYQCRPYSWLYFALWGIVFRNNGMTESPGAISPIDVLNRGGSYLYRDLRTNKNWMVG